MLSPSLVIFDCDGVLVDTERMANANLAEMICALGHPITGMECQRRFMGRTLEAVQEMVEDLTGTQLGADWPEQVRLRDLERFQQGVPAIPGVEAVLDDLDRRRVAYCVASSGKYAKMHATLGASGLLPRLREVLVSAQDCKQGKPAPDVFLLAAERMGYPASECIVIEDSLPGVIAAKAAGMTVLAYVEDPACDRDAMAAAGATLFEKMDALPGILFSGP